MKKQTKKDEKCEHASLFFLSSSLCALFYGKRDIIVNIRFLCVLKWMKKKNEKKAEVSERLFLCWYLIRNYDTLFTRFASLFFQDLFPQHICFRMTENYYVEKRMSRKWCSETQRARVERSSDILWIPIFHK